MPTFQDLRIWKEAVRLMTEINVICKRLPKEKRFQLIDQATRSSSSVPDNIAEGYTTYHYKDKINRLYDARKESGETQNHILKMEIKGYINHELSQKLAREYQVLIRSINGFINYVRLKSNSAR